MDSYEYEALGYADWDGYFEKEMARTKQIRESCFCLICNNPGIHTHWIKINNGDW